jgi:hypothetical protein
MRSDRVKMVNFTDDSQKVQSRSTAVVTRQNQKIGHKADLRALALPRKAIRIGLYPNTSPSEASAIHEFPNTRPNHDI